MKPNLIYTIALDLPGTGTYRNYAKMLVASLLRTGFSGQIIVIHNSPTPLYLIGREGVLEIRVEPGDLTGMAGLKRAWSWKYLARAWFNPADYGKIMFVDSDCLALHNVDPLLEGDWDIRYHVERGSRIQDSEFCGHLDDDEMAALVREGVNSGILAIRASVYTEVMEEWERIDQREPPQNDSCSDQASWNRLLLDTSLRSEPFHAADLALPLHREPAFGVYSKASLVHLIGGNPETKCKFGFGLFMGRFYTDPNSVFFNLIEI
jgi:hypothetical protein